MRRIRISQRHAIVHDEFVNNVNEFLLQWSNAPLSHNIMSVQIIIFEWLEGRHRKKNSRLVMFTRRTDARSYPLFVRYKCTQRKLHSFKEALQENVDRIYERTKQVHTLKYLLVRTSYWTRAVHQPTRNSRRCRRFWCNVAVSILFADGSVLVLVRSTVHISFQWTLSKNWRKNARH